MRKIVLTLTVLGTLLISNSLQAKKTIKFIGKVGYNTVTKAINELEAAHIKAPSEEPFEIIMQSPGGSVLYGTYLINTIRGLQNKGRFIIMTVDTLCASMCFSILQSADLRQSYPLGVLMQHKASGGYPKVLQELNEQLEKMSAKRIGISFLKWSKMVADEFWASPEKALKLNIIDNIVEKEYQD